MADDFTILRKKREEKGYTLKQVSNDLGVSISMICKLEKGVTSFTRPVVDKLNKYYGISLVPLKFKCSLVVYRDKKEWYVRINDELKIENKALKSENSRLRGLIEKYEGQINGLKTIPIEEHLAASHKKKT